MQLSTRFALSLTILFLGLVLIPSVALAQGQDCPPEPASNTTIQDGEVYAGPNCTLQSPGDLDSFVFSANSGDTYHMAVGINGSAPTNICLTLYNPSLVQIFSACSSVGYPHYQYSVVDDQMLTVTGTYTIAITETGSGTLNYGLGLERLFPFPPNAEQVNLGVQVNGDINPLTDSNTFTFQTATTGRQRASATVPNDANQNICMRVYRPDGTVVQGDVCTSIGYPHYVYTIQVDFTPPEDGNSMAFLYVAGNDGTQAYTFEPSCVAGTCPAPIETFTTLYSFGWSDGAHSFAGLIQDSTGNFYGTTADGGSHSDGTVFKITPIGALTTLHSFCSHSACPDGLVPQAGLVQASGNFYGTTSEGGANNYGTVFQITPSGTLTTLYSFDSTHGANPSTGLIPGSDGDLYGTTPNGGANDRGVVFKIDTSGNLTTLYSFCSQTNCADGFAPRASLVQTGDGTIYGTTYAGGAFHRGTFFKFTSAGLTTLLCFNTSEGVNPEGGLVLATDGNFYGTTSAGGSQNRGTFFKLTPAGALTVLFNFDSTHGAYPATGVVQATDGNFYGTAPSGGLHDRGTIFEITAAGAPTTLYSFDSTHGTHPEAGLVQGTDGNFYGATSDGGVHEFGIVFKLSVP